MAFIVPSQSLDTGSPILGALTGFTEGLSQGIRTRRNQDLAQNELQLRAQEQALRQKIAEHGLAQEQAQEQFAPLMGQYAAMSMDPTKTPQDKLAFLQDMAQRVPPKFVEPLMSMAHEDMQRQAIGQSKAALLQDLQQNHLRRYYSPLGQDQVGPQEQSPDDAAVQSMIQELQGTNLEGMPPQEAAHFIDSLRAREGQLRMDTAQHDIATRRAQRISEDLEASLQGMRTSGLDTSPYEAAVSLYSHGQIPDEKMAEMFPKIFGDSLLQMHRQALDENARLRAENERLRIERQPTVEQRANLQSSAIQERGQIQKDIAAGRTEAGLKTEQERTGRVGTELEALAMRNALAAAQTDKDWPKADTEEKQRAIVDKYVRLQQRKNGSLVLPGGGGAIGPQSPADILRGEVQSGKIKTNAQLEARAKELGVTLK